MPEAYKELYSGQPGTSAAAVYTVPGATQAIVKHYKAVNVAAVPVSIKLFQNGTTDAKCILPAIVLQPGEFLEWEGTITLAATNTLAAQASAASSITLTINGVEVS